jgi:DnaJ-class molecular chaperone
MLRESLGRFTQKMRTLLGKKRTRNSISALSVIEVTLSAKEAAYGVKKVIELTDEGRRRRVTVDISPGVRTGSVVRLQSKKDRAEELLAIVRVLPHPILSFTNKGVTAEIPISVREAIEGANITIPGFEETLTIRIPPGTQSGAELRVAERGVLRKDGSRGDLFVRLLIRIPESPEAVGLKEKIRELDVYYEAPVRKNFKSSLFDM